MARMFSNGTRLLNLHQMQTHQLCVVSSRHGSLQDKTAESFSSLRSLPVELRFFRQKAKGRASLMVVAVKKHQVDAKLSNLTLDMAHAMTDVSTVSADVEILKKEVSSVKVELTELAQAMTDVSTVSADVEVLKKEQAMTDVPTESADVEVLKKEVSSVKVELTELAGIVQMLRASGDRLDNHVSRYLESYEKYNEMNRMPYFYLILIVLVLNLILEGFLLMKFLKG